MTAQASGTAKAAAAANARPGRDLREDALVAASSGIGAWPRNGLSRRSDPAILEALRWLEERGLVAPTGEVRGDRVQYRATEPGRAVCAAMLALRHSLDPDGPATPCPAPKPRVRPRLPARP